MLQALLSPVVCREIAIQSLTTTLIGCGLSYPEFISKTEMVSIAQTLSGSSYEDGLFPLTPRKQWVSRDTIGMCNCTIFCLWKVTFALRGTTWEYPDEKDSTFSAFTG